METTMETAVTTTAQPSSSNPNFFSLESFKDAHRVAGVLATSKLIPKDFQNNIPDCIIAMEMSQRIGASIFAVMQSLYIVHGKPGWSAQFIIAALNSCGRFSPLRFDITEPKEQIVEGKKVMDRVCTAWAVEKGTNEKLYGPPVSIAVAHKEGWYGKNGSKWQTMPELMLRYRAATFFGRLYAPDILMGMKTMEEIVDMPEDGQPSKSVVDDLNARFGAKETIDASTGEVIAEQPSTGEHLGTIAQDQMEPVNDDATTAEINPDVQKFIREINEAGKGGSIAVDQWRMKHNKRVSDTFGSTTSDGFRQVMEYADILFCEIEESEKAEA
jgi:hypothetical protein